MYHTQMEAARQGIITEEMKIVAQKEYRSEEEIRDLVAKGQVAICANKNHKCLDPNGVGSMLRTKINVNLGVSRDCKDYDVEMKKVMAAVDMGAEAIMDLSSHGDTQPFRRKLTSECPAMIGTVPVYDSVIHYQRDLATLTAKDFLDVIRLHAEDGVDFVTLHCGITRKTIEQIKQHKRKMNIVSRGGSLVFAWMCMTGEENPFYEYYDEILEICREYDVTISLGDACRPGCLADASDVCQIEELVRLGELTKRAWEKDVQVMVEGPGHMPLDQIAANMKLQQTICMGAPFYVLGPIVTDIAPGYDHITAAIGGAVAASAGAAFLCYVTPAEHLALPNVEVIWDSVVERINGNDMVESITLRSKKTNESSVLPVQGVFIAVGIRPNSEPFVGNIAADEKGYLIAGEDCATSMPGVYAAGDIRTKKLRQIVTAVAEPTRWRARRHI